MRYNMLKKKRIRVLTHNDLDGIGCALVAKWAFEGVVRENFEVEVSYLNVGEVDKVIEDMFNSGEVNNYLHILITDISIQSEELAEKISDYNKKNGPILQLVDHHKTALWLNKYNWAEVVVEDNGVKQCGTSLMYNRFRSKIEGTEGKDFEWERKLVEDIRQLDTWDWTTTGNKTAYNLSILCDIIGQELMFKCFAYRLDCESELVDGYFTGWQWSLIEQELEKEKKAIESALEKVVFKEIDGKKAAVVIGASHSNAVMQAMYNKFDIDVAININMNKGTVGFRTNKDIDLTELSIVKAFGGGHAKACGAKLPFESIELLAHDMLGLTDRSWYFKGKRYTNRDEYCNAVREHCTSSKCKFYYGEIDECMLEGESSGAKCDKEMFKRREFLGYCTECGEEIFSTDRDRNEEGVYHCSKCGHPHCIEELWLEMPSYLMK